MQMYGNFKGLLLNSDCLGWLSKWPLLSTERIVDMGVCWERNKAGISDGTDFCKICALHFGWTHGCGWNLWPNNCWLETLHQIHHVSFRDPWAKPSQDTCLDFILKILPAIQIEKVRRCGSCNFKPWNHVVEKTKSMAENCNVACCNFEKKNTLLDQNPGGGLFFYLFLTPPTWGNHPIWRACFSNGLVQPPSGNRSLAFEETLRECWYSTKSIVGNRLLSTMARAPFWL